MPARLPYSYIDSLPRSRNSSGIEYEISVMPSLLASPSGFEASEPSS